MQVAPYKIPHPFKKLSKERIDSIVNDIALGSTNNRAALCNGISEPIFYIWLAQGRVDIETDQDTLCASLVKSLARVEQAEIQSCRQDAREFKEGHKGAHWTLEKVYWRDFGSHAAAKEIAAQLDRMEYADTAKRQELIDAIAKG